MPVPLYLSGVVIIFAFLNLGKNISFSDSLVGSKCQADPLLLAAYFLFPTASSPEPSLPFLKILDSR